MGWALPAKPWVDRRLLQVVMVNAYGGLLMGGVRCGAVRCCGKVNRRTALHSGRGFLGVIKQRLESKCRWFEEGLYVSCVSETALRGGRERPLKRLALAIVLFACGWQSRSRKSRPDILVVEINRMSL
jgi:hypothetical protein